MYGQTQRLEGSQTSPHRLDSGRLRRAGRFGAHLVTLATFVITLIQPKRAKSGGSRERLLASQLYRLRVGQEPKKSSARRNLRRFHIITREPTRGRLTQLRPPGSWILAPDS